MSGAALGLTFLLGLRHGLDPDHIAIIDGFAFRAAEERPGLAPWVGTLFATGHSISGRVMASAVGPQLASGRCNQGRTMSAPPTSDRQLRVVRSRSSAASSPEPTGEPP